MGKLKAIVSIAVTILIFSLVVVAIVKKQSAICEKIEIKIAASQNQPLVSVQEIEKMIADSNVVVIGKTVKDLRSVTGEVADIITHHPFILQCKRVYFSRSSMIIEIIQSHPLVHVFSENDQYFIDDEGFIIPFHPNIHESILVANGHIDYNFSRKIVADSVPLLHSLYTVAKEIKADPFCNAQFKQLYVNKNQAIELIPVFGNQLVLFGDHSDAKAKLLHLSKMYSDALPYHGINDYTLLDARFKNRIIAKK
ncbi:hypothetical protein LJC68_02920 [Bacteroidales bacterium OttesenSCG-928-B11]|nr:hypothetical protein [Bacteroidales bacterium OttesenSCG-928-C03]MDL2311816.1 hypothetical protein [Bacteroidales bacterium OttesenSCG-928-B11]